VHFSRRLNVSRDSEEVISEGKYTWTNDRKGTTSNSRKSDGRNKQTIGGRGPKSLSRRDVSDARELQKVLQSISMCVRHSKSLCLSFCWVA